MAPSSPGDLTTLIAWTFGNPDVSGQARGFLDSRAFPDVEQHAVFWSSSSLGANRDNKAAVSPQLGVYPMTTHVGGKWEPACRVWCVHDPVY